MAALRLAAMAPWPSLRLVRHVKSAMAFVLVSKYSQSELCLLFNS